MKKVVILAQALLLVVSGIIAIPAQAATTPSPFTAVGESWVDVPTADKIYLEDFYDSDSDSNDDYSIYYVPEGVTCADNSPAITTNGPMLIFDNVNENECSQGGVAFDPYDPQGSNGTVRSGRVPFGFDINFFGTTFDGAYPNTNGGISFQNPTDRYDYSMIELANDSEAAILGAYNVDLEYRSYSNFWFAQTTVDGVDAAVFSWENFSPHDLNVNSLAAATELASFQIVILNRGGGDFDAYFNYDKITVAAGDSQGYSGPRFWIDLSKDVTVGSNVVNTTFTEGWAGCTLAEDEEIFSTNDNKTDITDTNLVTKTIDNDFYVKYETASTLSFWEDSGCATTPINISALQDVDTSGNVYVEYIPTSPTSDFAASIGWATYTASPFSVSVNEIFPNISLDRLKDGGADELISQTINTSVPGRIVLGQRGGVTVGDPLDPDSAPLNDTPIVTDVPYYGPLQVQVPKTAVQGGNVSVSGLRLDTISKVFFGTEEVDFSIVNGEIRFTAPVISPDIYTVRMYVPVNKVYLTFKITLLQGTGADVCADQRVNAGTFKGFVAIYAKCYEGSRLSAKVGEDWVIVESLDSNYERIIEKTRWIDHGLQVRIFIDRVLMATIPLSSE